MSTVITRTTNSEALLLPAHPLLVNTTRALEPSSPSHPYIITAAPPKLVHLECLIHVSANGKTLTDAIGEVTEITQLQRSYVILRVSGAVWEQSGYLAVPHKWFAHHWTTKLFLALFAAWLPDTAAEELASERYVDGHRYSESYVESDKRKLTPPRKKAPATPVALPPRAHTRAPKMADAGMITWEEECGNV